MPVIKSAKKRVRVTRKATVRNARTRRKLREALKAFAATLSGGKADDIQKAQRAAVSALDTAAKKAVIHKNKAARRKSQLARQAKAAGVKPGTKAKKAPAKKTAAKKAAAKKTAAGKPVAKKTAKK